VERYFAVWVCSFGELSNFGGDSGQGMTGSALSGILVKDMIVGKKNAWGLQSSTKTCHLENNTFKYGSRS